jgi:tetratricopeptide (TPR) repeat protein
MSLLKIPADTALTRALLGGFVLLCVGGAAVAGKWAIGSTLAAGSREREITEVGVALAPGDALARNAHAAVLEKTFDMEAFARSLGEHEAAVAISPHDYRLWLGLGRSRERNGDRVGAEAAYRRAQELAPNYSRIHWALGNLLVRDGRFDEGFAHIRRAAATDSTFAAPAVAAAWLAFGGDVPSVTAALGDGDNTRVELARSLAAQKRFDESVTVWNSIPAERRANFADQGKAIAEKAFAEGRFRISMNVSNEFAETPSQPETVTNGGFESPIKPKSAGPFDWKNIEGVYPQIGPTGGQKKAGEASLLIRFGDPTNLEFRPLSQTIAVEPGGRYSLSLSHRSELKTQAVFRWEVIARTSGARLAATEPLAAGNGWIDSSIDFAVPADVDGITVRLVRENCAAPICTVAGTIWFDEFQMRRL